MATRGAGAENSHGPRRRFCSAAAPLVAEAQVGRSPGRNQRDGPFLVPLSTVQLNLTSNYYLLGDSIRRDAGQHSGGTYMIGVLQSHGAPVLLSTDDDGVWPIDSCPHKHHQHHSLAAEYCKAITSKLVRAKQILQQMLDNGKRYRFWDGSLEPVAPLRISNQRFAHRTAIALHPRLVYFVLDRAAGLASSPGPFVDLYRRSYFSAARQRRT